MIISGQINLVINTPWGVGPRLDGYEIRAACVATGVPCVTTIQGAAACVQAIEALVRGDMGVRPLQSFHAGLQAAWEQPYDPDANQPVDDQRTGGPGTGRASVGDTHRQTVIG